MKQNKLYLIAVFLPLLVWSCGGKDPLPDLIFGAAQGLGNGVVYDDIIPDGANKVTFDNIADYYTGE